MTTAVTLSAEVAKANQDAQGFMEELPDRPSCDNCPCAERHPIIIREKLASGNDHVSSNSGTLMCCWGGLPRFLVTRRPDNQLCTKHPDYGKPWPKVGGK